MVDSIINISDKQKEVIGRSPILFVGPSDYGKKRACRSSHRCLQRLWCLGDYFLKLASTKENALATIWSYIGFAVYPSTAFGWAFVMKHLKVATISVVFFRESLSYYEVVA
jgi:hypothetical protein